MSDQPRIPDAETRARSVAKLRELVKRMDAGIFQLDELIAGLEEDIRNSPLTAYRLERAKRLATKKSPNQNKFSLH